MADKTSNTGSWRKQYQDLAWRIADKARFHAVAHHVSADWYERLDTVLTYTSVLLGAFSTVGAGSLLANYFDNKPDHKQKVIVLSAASSIVQAFITSLNSGANAPRRLRDEHLKAAVELQGFREKLNAWYRVDLLSSGISVEMVKRDYDRFLEEKKRLESDLIKSENWTFKEVNYQISHSDKRREKLKQEHKRDEAK